MIELRVEQNNGLRLDVFLVEQLEGKTRSAVQKLIADGCITINGTAASKNTRLRAGDKITVDEPAPVLLAVTPENIPLDVLYEDSDLLVVNKPKGMVVHPAAGNENGTLVNALLYHCRDSLSGINGVVRPGIVHRIDKDTSGLLIVAKNDHAHLKLADQIEKHSFSRVYHAVVYGNIKEDTGVIETQLGRHPSDRKKMAVLSSGGKRAVTHFRVLERFGTFTYLELRLETGRTHQIRVHMASLGHPVAGDPVYGPKKVLSFLNGQCLHAKTIGFIHPTTGEYLELNSELPPVFAAFLQKLRQESGKAASPSMTGILMAVDLDGTLLRNDKTISPKNLTAIQQFRNAGGIFCPATGRSIPTAQTYLDQLAVTDPVILYNGAMLYDPVKKEPIVEIQLPQEAQKAVSHIQQLFGDTVGIEVLADYAMYVVTDNDWIDRHLNDSGHPVTHQCCPVTHILDKPWFKVVFIGHRERMADIREALLALRLEAVTVVQSAENILEILPASAGKGTAFQRLCRHLGISETRTVAVGDFDNDLEMLSAAHFGVAMSNGCRELQAAADLVVSSNEEDGVAEAIQYVMDNSRKLF